MKVSIIIPCYNEEESVGSVLRGVKALCLGCEKEIIAVDDGSTDRSSKIIEEFTDVIPIRHNTNRGKGAALRSGIENCTGEIVVMLDADCEHCPEDMPMLLGPVFEGKADAVLGSRFLSSPNGMSRVHFLGNKVLALVASLLYRHKLTDITSGYRAIRRELLNSICLESNGFSVEPELLAKLLTRASHVAEVPVRYEFRKTGQSKISWKHGLESLWTLIRYSGRTR